MLKKIIFTAVISSLVGCGGEDGDSSEQTPPNRVKSQLYVTRGKLTEPIQSDIGTKDQENPYYTYFINYQNLNNKFEATYTELIYKFNIKENGYQKNYNFYISYNIIAGIKQPISIKLSEELIYPPGTKYNTYLCSPCNDIDINTDLQTGESHINFNHTILKSEKEQVELTGLLSGFISKPLYQMHPIQTSNTDSYIQFGNQIAYKTKITDIAILNDQLSSFYGTLTSDDPQANFKSFHINFLNNKISSVLLDLVPPYSNYFFVHIEKDSLQNIKFDPTEYSFTFKDVKTDYDPELKVNGQIRP